MGLIRSSAILFRRNLAGRWQYVLMFALASGCQFNPQINPGHIAPEISGEDAFGKKVSLSEYRGKVVLLDFWATWCPPCVAEIPNELALQQRFQGRPFTIFGISRDKDRDRLKEFLQQQKLPWPTVVDADDSISRQWGINGIPTFVLLDQNGTVINTWVGAGHSQKIDQAVENALAAVKP